MVRANEKPGSSWNYKDKVSKFSQSVLRKIQFKYIITTKISNCGKIKDQGRDNDQKYTYVYVNEMSFSFCQSTK